MALLKPSEKPQREQVRLAISKPILDEIRAYCDWAGIHKIDEFMEQASQLVLKRDRAWRSSNPNKSD